MKIVLSIIILLLSLFCLVIGILHFKRKIKPFNNGYLYADKTQRDNLDLVPLYRQSTTVFMLLALMFLFDFFYLFFNSKLCLIFFWLVLILCLIYAIVSSIKLNK